MSGYFATKDALMELLRAEVKRLGEQRLVAKKFGVSDAYLSDVLNGRRDLGPTLVKALGFRRVVLYESREESRR